MEDVFRTNARIVFEIGKESIENKIIALSEIIKNSYDANSTKCTIVVKEEGDDISLLDKEISSLEIIDNGIGMSKDDLLNNWLVIGTNSKKKLKENIIYDENKSRIPVGEKGIGRFAVNKLGNDITIISKKVGYPTYSLHIDFSSFSDDKMLEEVKVNIESCEEDLIPTSSGTKIVINDLLEKWSYDDIKEVYCEVLKIQSPFKEKSDIFDVDFITKDNTIFSNLLTTEDVLKYSLWNSSIEILPNTTEGIMKFEFTPYTSMVGLKNISSKELIKYQNTDKRLSTIDISKYNIGPIYIRLYAFHRTPKVLNMLGLKKMQLKNYLDENGGVRVYRSGQRIFNYGSKEEDWLGLNLKRLNSPGTKLSKNILIGVVEIDSCKSTDLIEKTNREGFIENEAFLEFKKIVNLIVDEFALRIIPTKNEIKKNYDKNVKIEKIDESMEELISEIEDAEFKEEANKSKLLKLVNRISKEYQESRKTYLSIASNSVDFNMVFHDVDKQIKHVIHLLDSPDNNSENIKIAITNINDILTIYKDLITNRDFKQVSSEKIVSKFKSYAHYRLKDHKIELDINFESFVFKAIESQILRIFINLFDNSVYWLEMQDNKKVYINICVQDNVPIIYYADNGPGLGVDDANILFRPFVTRKKGGLGLGLYIVNEIVSLHDGKIDVIEDCNEIPAEFCGAKFKIELGDLNGN